MSDVADVAYRAVFMRCADGHCSQRKDYYRSKAYKSRSGLTFSIPQLNMKKVTNVLPEFTKEQFG
jgi:hypothetical protein